MTPEYVRRDEFNTALAAILAEMRAIRLSIGGLDSKMEQGFAAIETRLTDVETFQKTLLETYQTTTQSILTQMAESHAQVMEQINDLKRQGNQDN